MQAGQRWVSDSEPEMGLGIILEIEGGIVDIIFPATEERRKYAMTSAPLRRVLFGEGDKVISHDDKEHVVVSVQDSDDGPVTYVTDLGQLEESELNDHLSINTPAERLMGGAVDEPRIHRLRIESLYRNSAIKGSKIRGFVGGRTDLIPHQISIVNELSKRVHPRALLADEVGLGKTIEACMIMHRLHLTGRADRVLILLPESLINQWFVELLRRFNMMFSLFDEERCLSIEAGDGSNPFLDSQLVIANIDFVSHSEQRTNQIVDAGWDMLIVDEAHHIEWSPEEASASYLLVEQLAAKTEALLLLTATPQQLGPEGHFARLRLLDSDRFSDLDAYLKESDSYEQTAKLIGKIQQGKSLTKTEEALLGAHSARVKSQLDELSEDSEGSRGVLTETLLDSFGPGRVMFRNTRDHLKGFPQRIAHLEQIEEGSLIQWLVKLIQDLGDEKVLLIVHTREAVERISAELQAAVQVKVAQFHEDLSLIQRDRNAAYFAEDEGAQILLCSEIGSEGRNFQFAHHLVLLDLPDNPELLEQRIGRLDRIGQTGDIHIHVPYIANSESEVIARWYSEGLEAFTAHSHGAYEVYQQCAEMIELLKIAYSDEGMKDLISFTRKQIAQLQQKLMSGQEKLLALNSYRSQDAQNIIDKIDALDDDPMFEKFVIKLLDHLGVGIEDLSDRAYVFTIRNMMTDLGADIPDEGLAVTFDRDEALQREDLQFISMDHPIVRNALDVFLASESGNVQFGVWENTGEKGIYLEAYYIVEAIAPSSLHVERFLAPRPIRVAVDHQMADHSEAQVLKKVRLREGNLRKLLTNDTLRKTVLPSMLETCEKLAGRKAEELSAECKKRMHEILENELIRLKDLALVNDAVSENEVSKLQGQIEALDEVLSSYRIRLDGLRLIWRS